MTFSRPFESFLKINFFSGKGYFECLYLNRFIFIILLSMENNEFRNINSPWTVQYVRVLRDSRDKQICVYCGVKVYRVIAKRSSHFHKRFSVVFFFNIYKPK